MPDDLNFLGNIELLKSYKIAFLCSRQIPAVAVLKCYDWAVEMRNKKQCVIGGFHSPLEKDVLDILIKGDQPIIVVLAKRINKEVHPYFQKAFDKKRILIISNFDEKIIRASEETAVKRNKLMLELSDEIVIGYCSKNGLLKTILENNKKPISYLTQT